MKKILFASTALVLSAGFAVAEVTVGGDGRMGILYTEGGGAVAGTGTTTQQATAQAAVDALNTQLTTLQTQLDQQIAANDAAGAQATLLQIANVKDALTAAQEKFNVVAGTSGSGEFAFTSRIRISFTATGETDNGLAFGGSIRADNATGGTTGTAGSVFVSSSFGKIAMGDVDGGAKAAVGQVSGVGLTGLGDANEVSYISTPVDPSVLYTYTFGAFNFYASADQISDANDAYGVGVKYDAGTFYAAIGYETQDTTSAGQAESTVALGAGTSFAGFDLKAVYLMRDVVGGANNDQYAVSAGFDLFGIGATAFYRDGDDLADASYGFGGTKDLGGGASLKGGIVHNGGASDADDIRADFGITMSF